MSEGAVSEEECDEEEDEQEEEGAEQAIIISGLGCCKQVRELLERDDERMSFGEGEGSDEIWMCVPLCVFCVCGR